MRKFIYAGLLAFGLAPWAIGQPATTGYTNYTIVETPININATNFVNYGIFDFSVDGYTLGPYYFSSVVSFTNRNQMDTDNGFTFDTESPNQFGPPPQQALSFANQNPGQVYAGAQFPLGNPSTYELTTSSGYPILNVNAAYVQNSGLLDVGQTGILTITGNTLDLRNGFLNVEGLAQLITNQDTANGNLVGGMFVEGWGAGTQTNAIKPTLFTPASTFVTPTFSITEPGGAKGTTDFEVENAIYLAYTNQPDSNDTITQIVIAGDSLGEVNISAGFDTNGGGGGGGFGGGGFGGFGGGGGPSGSAANPVIHWSYLETANGQTTSNDIYLEDTIATAAALGLETNSTSLSGAAIQVPTNYTFTTTFSDAISSGNAVFGTSLLSNAFSGPRKNAETNAYTALEVDFQGATAVPDSTTPGSDYSNVVGRAEINAGSLDLSNSVLNAANFLNLNVSNYAGTPTAFVSYANANFNLGNTNGTLVVTNLILSSQPFLNGPLDCYSAVWSNLTTSSNISTNITTATNGGTATTNVVTNSFTVTNLFSVTMVMSELQTQSPVYIEDLELNATNVILSDEAEVLDNCVINAQNFTLTLNKGTTAFSPFGALFIDSGDFWSPNMPFMQNFTNNGEIFVDNGEAFFQNRQVEQFPSANDGPWQSFVNEGTVETYGGLSVWANQFANGGTLYSEVGLFQIQATTAGFSNGECYEYQGDMQITAGSLTFSNETLQTAYALSLRATNLLTDENTYNDWSDGDNFSVYVLPTNGPADNGLLYTTIQNTLLTGTISQNYWAGRPSSLVNLSAPGLTNQLPTMSNNAPIGELVLTGSGSGSAYDFHGLDTVNPYAIYVDRLELEGNTSRLTTNGTSHTFPGINVDPNVTVYFLDAFSSTNGDISTKLAGANGGRFVWVSNYVGVFSVTNVIYPDGKSFNLNRGLVASMAVPEPAVASNTVLSINVSKQGASTANISWRVPASSTNYLEYRTPPATNWTVLTNFVQGPQDGTVTISDLLHTNRIYRVMLNPPK